MLTDSVLIVDDDIEALDEMAGAIAVLQKTLSIDSIGRFISTRLAHDNRQPVSHKR